MLNSDWLRLHQTFSSLTLDGCQLSNINQCWWWVNNMLPRYMDSSHKCFPHMCNTNVNSQIKESNKV